MPALKEEVKATLVQALACYDTPTQAAELALQEHGVKIDRAQVAKYDPTKPGGKSLGRKYRDLFYATREAFLKDTASIPIAQQSFRLRSLNRLHEQAVQRGNAVVAAALLEQASKEVGGAFTNKRELSGPNGAPIQAALDVSSLPTPVLAEIMKARDAAQRS